MAEENKLIDGKALADGVLLALAQKIAQKKLTPVLAVVLVGDNDASRLYVRNKQKAAAQVGINCQVIELAQNVSEAVLLKEIESLNQNQDIHGIIIQQPLPAQISAQKIIEAVDAKKDVDGFSPLNLGRLQMNSSEAIIAATPKGVLRMIESVLPELSGKHAVIIGRSNIVGKPLASLLLNQNCTVTLTHSKTQNLPEIVKLGDIVVVACGSAKMVKKSWVKKGAVVIDVGINRDENGKLCGDVDFDDVCTEAAYISPVPKGVGPMTVAMLLENTFQACCQQKNVS